MEFNKRKIVALELFSGIGGFHYSLSDIPNVAVEVCGAVDINTSANATYCYNFTNTKQMQRNIESFTVSEVEKLNLDLIWMSPPCQPFTRVGKYMDSGDVRTIPFLHILSLIPQLSKRPSYILLENVKGFETSDARLQLVKVLKESGYVYQEFLLTPQQFGIPNSRLRYYIVAKQLPLQFNFATSEAVMNFLPRKDDDLQIKKCENAVKLKPYLENLSDELIERYLVPDKVLTKFGKLLDIVNECSTRSCCFTKAYTHYAEGTGSVLHRNQNSSVSDVYLAISDGNLSDLEKLQLLRSLQLRYFTPREVANLLGFPADFKFPTCMTTKQQYRLLGNSLCVTVVHEILKLCL